jgi:hypothetical protein
MPTAAKDKSKTFSQLKKGLNKLIKYFFLSLDMATERKK